MSVLRDFIDEIASELDACTDKPLPYHWISFLKLLADIDQDDKMGELCQQTEQIVSQRDAHFQDRCLAADPAMAAAFTGRARCNDSTFGAPPNGSQPLATDDFSFYATRAKLSKKKESPNDTSISVIRRRKPGGWNTSRLGLPRFGLFVSEMVQHLSLQKD